MIAWVVSLLLAGDILAGSKVIDERAIEEDLFTLSRQEMEGRDSPSAALRRASKLISARFSKLGLVPAPDAEARLERYLKPSAQDGATVVKPDLFLRPFTRGLEAPVPDECSFTYSISGSDDPGVGVMGVDWVPVVGCAGSLKGEIEFAGFGIRSDGDRYDDFSGKKDLEGKVAVIIGGEPRHKRKFDGPEQSEFASLWSKLEALKEAGVSGVMVVRRGSELPKGKRPPFEALSLEYRYTHASFPGVKEPRPPRRRPSVVEITPDFAEVLIGEDVLKIASKVDRSGTPKKVNCQPCTVNVESTLRLQDVRIDNVVGILPGSDPGLAEEFVVIGAHYDHIGVDAGGRVGPGADDNGSGTTGLLAVTEALTVSKPRRSIIVCAFAGEEDGLLGSKAICALLPVSKDQIVAMINMDMIGRGPAGEVAVLGTKQNPSLLDVLRRANKLGKTGVRELVTGKGDDLWQRSDHYSFHQVGIPTLFFFEGLPISRNADYHTWRDRAGLVDADKIENTCKLVHQTACLLANDEFRPPPPSSRR
jgi:hypothetical protein